MVEGPGGDFPSVDFHELEDLFRGDRAVVELGESGGAVFGG